MKHIILGLVIWSSDQESALAVRHGNTTGIDNVLALDGIVVDLHRIALCVRQCNLWIRIGIRRCTPAAQI